MTKRPKTYTEKQVTKLVEKYGKVKGNKEFIAKEDNALLKSVKITETNLKALEDKIK